MKNCKNDCVSNNSTAKHSLLSTPVHGLDYKRLHNNGAMRKH